MTEHTKLPWHVEGMTLCVVSDHAPKGRMRVADIRGWGYLTGKGDGALGLSEDDAFAIQEANAALIVNAVNNHEALLRTLQHIAAMKTLTDDRANRITLVAAIEMARTTLSAVKAISNVVGYVKVTEDKRD
jgi:hypothetical protein